MATCPGEHEPIIDRAIWVWVHEVLATNAKRRGRRDHGTCPVRSIAASGVERLVLGQVPTAARVARDFREVS